MMEANAASPSRPSFHPPHRHPHPLSASDAQKAATYSTENESLQPIRGHGLLGHGSFGSLS